MRKYFSILSSCIFTLLLLSCNNSVSKYLCFEDVVYVSGFPKSIELEKVAPQDIDLMGCVDFLGNDSLLIFKMMGNDYHWKIYSFPDLKEEMYLLKQGRGPQEFINMPGNEYFHNNNIQIWMSSENKMANIDLSASLNHASLELDTMFHLPINGTALNCVHLHDSLYFTVLYQYNSFHRCLLKGNEYQELDHLKSINEISVSNDLNSIAAVRRYEPSQGKVVEGLLHLNQINLYSLEDNTFAKTICVGEKLTDLYRIDDSRKNNWTKYYSNIITHQDYFAAIYFNASREDFFSGKMDKVDIQFFNWEGEPLLNLTVPYSAENFFIHKNKDLYVLSVHGEKEYLYKYDLGEILNEHI